jgi:hypothetical protein
MKRFTPGLSLLLGSAATLLAQNSPPDGSATPAISDREAAGFAALFAGFICLFWVIYLAIWLGIAIWVTRDAKRRQSPNAVLVTVLAWIPPTTIIGLIVHLLTRPKLPPSLPNP